MLAIIVSWICNFFVIITFGDMVLLLYKKMTGKLESYNVLDTFIIGICFTVSLLAILSFWFPANFHILILFVILSALYWSVNIKRLKEYRHSIKLYIQQYSLLELCPYIFLSFFFVLTPVWSFSVKLDPFIYHHANVMWNESYSVIPGLANLDEKFGFNSNYFLLLATFSLRPLFGELIIGLQSLLAFLIAAHVYTEILRTKFDIKRVILFFTYIVLIFFNQNEMSETSTDIVPTLIIFYIISKIVLHPDLLKRELLFYVIVPVTLITFKLSTSLVLIICLMPIYYVVIRRKEYKKLLFVLCFAIIVFIPWLIRNVIISGYLVFPLYEINLFSFDWQVPLNVVQAQKDFIHSYSVDKMLTTLRAFDVRDYFFYSTVVVLLLCSASLLYIGGYLLRNRKLVNPVYFLVYLVLFFNILFWAFSAPDVRFGYGLIFGVVFFAFYLFFSKKTFSILSRKLINTKSQTVNLGLALLFVFSLVWGYYGYRWASKYKNYLVENYDVDIKGAWVEMLTVPIKLTYQKDRELKRENERFGTNDKYSLKPYVIGDSLTLYVSSSKLGFVFDCIPAVSDCEVNSELLFHNYRLIEMRGKDIKTGFRSKSLQKQ